MNKWIAVTAIAMLLLTGCGVSGDRNGRNTTTGQPTAQQTADKTVRKLSGEQKAAAPQTNAVVQADHLANLAQRVQGVKNANCVVLGNTAIVGINVDGKLDRSRVGTIKYSVAEALDKDPHGLKTFVTADADINNRLAEMTHDIRNGHPVQGFGNELADIMGRIIPQMSTGKQAPQAPAPSRHNHNQNGETKQKAQ
ncbi:YhcN/YlaJ family sporulation lipoprotein [Paenibacillus sp. P96]|uniref:YhcN/YlaJ family sporulation lipoprotein n=1 Tax=Paenibacillus zeirhizosphaerae TaxID=2987519 RepID=A0ABT9FR01_9BACL|nr:YhcN/YlaJ family sporulation lipoprotein [Paenibacillus sp. P96]MDP4096956.1 YhcN/YlaJ family sporulation lipoprotein [Paenibacillus sp. P96]